MNVGKVGKATLGICVAAGTIAWAGPPLLKEHASRQRLASQRVLALQKQMIVGTWASAPQNDPPLSLSWTYEDIHPDVSRKDYQAYARSQEFAERYNSVHMTHKNHMVIYRDGFMVLGIGVLPYWDVGKKRWTLPKFEKPLSLLPKTAPNFRYRVIGVNDDALDLQVDRLTPDSQIAPEHRDLGHFQMRLRASQKMLESWDKQNRRWVVWHRLAYETSKAPVPTGNFSSQ
jgi:hypothetical protein